MEDNKGKELMRKQHERISSWVNNASGSNKLINIGIILNNSLVLQTS